MSRLHIPPADRLLSGREVQQMLGINGDTLSAWARSRKIKSIRDPGGRRKYRQSEVDRILSALTAAGIPPPELTLHDDLRAVEAQWPGWHCWLSDEGRCWAGTAHYAYRDGSGITVDAGHVSQLGHAIAEAVHTWQSVAA